MSSMMMRHMLNAWQFQCSRLCIELVFRFQIREHRLSWFKSTTDFPVYLLSQPTQIFLSSPVDLFFSLAQMKHFLHHRWIQPLMTAYASIKGYKKTYSHFHAFFFFLLFSSHVFSTVAWSCGKNWILFVCHFTANIWFEHCGACDACQNHFWELIFFLLPIQMHIIYRSLWIRNAVRIAIYAFFLEPIHMLSLSFCYCTNNQNQWLIDDMCSLHGSMRNHFPIHISIDETWKQIWFLSTIFFLSKKERRIFIFLVELFVWEKRRKEIHQFMIKSIW